MLKQSPGWAAATLIAVFVAGGLVGWGLARAGHGHRGWGWGWGGGGGGDGPPWARGGEARRGPAGFLKRELDLTPTQEDSVQAIFARHRPQMETLWREMRPRFDSVRAEISREISAQLTPAQRTQFQELERPMDERLRREPKPDPP